jgi:hypothetical protein
MKKILLAFAVVTTAILSMAMAQNGRPEDEPTSNLSFHVVRDSGGKPVRNASVVLHPVNRNGQQSRGGFELKTDADGKASFDGVPYGKLRIQVLAHGFQTFGEDYTIEKPTTEIAIKLKRPTDQYSIYSDQNNTKKDDAPAPDASDKKEPDKKPQ